MVDKPHIVIHENVPAFFTNLLVLLLGRWYDLDTAVLRPLPPFPVRRTRQYTILVLRDQVKLTRSWAITAAQLEAFARQRCRVSGRLALTVEDLFVARPPTSMTFALTARQQEWLEEYTQKFPENKVYDLCQNPAVFARISDAAHHLPTITRNAGRFYSVARGRWLLPSELLLANGMPVAPWAAELAGASLRRHLIEDFGTVAQTNFAGNAMHLASIQSALAFVLVCSTCTLEVSSSASEVGGVAAPPPEAPPL